MNPTVEQTDILGDEVLAELIKIHNQQPPSSITRPEWEQVDALIKHAAALQAQLDAAVKMNRELKIIVDIGTDDDPGTALSKLHKIQHQAIEQFRRRAVEAFRDTAKVWRERGKVQVASQCEDAADFIQQLPAKEEGV